MGQYLKPKIRLNWTNNLTYYESVICHILKGKELMAIKVYEVKK